LVRENTKGTAETPACVLRTDDIIDEATVGSDERISKLIAVFGSAAIDLFLGKPAVEHFDGTFSAHHCNFSIGPCVIEITAQVLGVHYDIGTTIGFTRDDGDFGNGGFGVGIEQLCTMFDDAAMLLRYAGEEAGYVDESDNGNTKRIAETYEAGGFAG